MEYCSTTETALHLRVEAILACCDFDVGYVAVFGIFENDRLVVAPEDDVTDPKIDFDVTTMQSLDRDEAGYLKPAVALLDVVGVEAVEEEEVLAVLVDQLLTKLS